MTPKTAETSGTRKAASSRRTPYADQSGLARETRRDAAVGSKRKVEGHVIPIRGNGNYPHPSRPKFTGAQDGAPAKRDAGASRGRSKQRPYERRAKFEKSRPG
jgi:hypothetical protein